MRRSAPVKVEAEKALERGYSFERCHLYPTYAAPCILLQSPLTIKPVRCDDCRQHWAVLNGLNREALRRRTKQKKNQLRRYGEIKNLPRGTSLHTGLNRIFQLAQFDLKDIEIAFSELVKTLLNESREISK